MVYVNLRLIFASWNFASLPSYRCTHHRGDLSIQATHAHILNKVIALLTFGVHLASLICNYDPRGFVLYHLHLIISACNALKHIICFVYFQMSLEKLPEIFKQLASIDEFILRNLDVSASAEYNRNNIAKNCFAYFFAYVTVIISLVCFQFMYQGVHYTFMLSLLLNLNTDVNIQVLMSSLLAQAKERMAIIAKQECPGSRGLVWETKMKATRDLGDYVNGVFLFFEVPLLLKLLNDFQETVATMAYIIFKGRVFLKSSDGFVVSTCVVSAVWFAVIGCFMVHLIKIATSLNRQVSFSHK